MQLFAAVYEVIKHARNDQRGQPRDVRADDASDRPLVERQLHKRNLYDHGEGVDAQGIPVKFSVDAIDVVHRRHAVAALADQVVVHQVNSAPRHQHIHLTDQDVTEVRTEVVLSGDGDPSHYDSDNGHDDEFGQQADPRGAVEAGKDRSGGHVRAV